jgi:NAD(P)-dependent dehydrogenase (short-subunit alcohol dehydrogenase family)
MAVDGDTVALVTGANRGIGLEIARKLAEAKMRVILTARNAELGSTATERLRAEGFDVTFIQLDVTEERSVAVAAQRVSRHFERLDILINNSGILLEGDFSDPNNEIIPAPSSTRLVTLQQTFAVNTFGAILVTNAMLPMMRRAKAGHILFISSKLASLSLTDSICSGRSEAKHLGLLAYASSKTALNAASLLFALELKDEGIRVNSVDPGHCATDINNNSGNRHPSAGAQIVADVIANPDLYPTGTFVGERGLFPW